VRAIVPQCTHARSLAHSEIFFETFTTTLTDGREVDLLGGGSGAATRVTFDNRLKYVALVEAARLTEANEQLQVRCARVCCAYV
jgi:hypothetical protein